MNVEEITKLCESRVDERSLVAESHALCVDGTSAARKSSVLAATNATVKKVQWYFHSINTNTYFPSMLGYISSGIQDQNTGAPHFNDRSFLNPLEWNLLWRIMNDYNARFGNTDPESDDRGDDIKRALDDYRNLFRALKNSYIYRPFRERFNGIAIIDSDTERCDILRSHRNEGSDLERSSWRFYTYLQNLMYTELYPKTYIDLAWFDAYDIESVTVSVATYLDSLLSRLASRATKIEAPGALYKLPVPRHDLTLSNISVHVYRSIGRAMCKSLSSSAAIDLDNYIPPYLDVYESSSSESTDRYLNACEIERPNDSTRLSYAKSVAVRSGGVASSALPETSAVRFADSNEAFADIE